MAAVGAGIALLLAACLGSVWLARAGGVIGRPTPTLTATPRPVGTPTADRRATTVAEDAATQAAYLAALATRGIEDPFRPTDTPVAVLLPVVVALEPTPTFVPEQPQSPLEPAPELPAESTATETPYSAESPLAPPDATPTPVPVADGDLAAAATPTAPVDGGEPLAGEPPTPSPTFTVAPIPSPTPAFDVPTPTPPGAAPAPTFAFTTASLSGVVVGSAAEWYVGPSSVFTNTGQSAAGTALTLFNRDETGEWLYAAPTGGTPGWVRSASVRAVNNPAPQGMPTTESPNDVRRLSFGQPPPATTPLPTPMAPGPADFPVFRHDRSMQARVGQLPRPVLQLAWPASGSPQTSGFTSGVVVFGDNVVAASSDNHIYSHSRESGSQRWRYDVREAVTAAPGVEGGMVYVVTPSGLLYAFNDLGGAAPSPWPLQLTGRPYGGVVGWGNRLFITTQDTQDHLIMVDRINGRIAINYTAANTTFPHAPAVGNQLVYIAGSALLALDAYSNPAAAPPSGEARVVWRRDADTGYSFTTSPVYSYPGVRALAELYVGDNQGRVLGFDANTGEPLPQGVSPVTGQPVTALAVNSRTVFVASSGLVRAFARENLTQELWRQPFGGSGSGSLITDETRVMAAATNGAVQIYDASFGATLAGNVQTTEMAGPVAVSGDWLYVAGRNGTLFGLRGGGQ